ncbi:MAG TPA: hypothetical protein VHH36_00030, partial [Candidatus Thermoplasmatota archaeon]|nr:hypothetical protein [Candidatus Thermoplasmatota archaeon]
MRWTLAFLIALACVAPSSIAPTTTVSLWLSDPPRLPGQICVQGILVDSAPAYGQSCGHTPGTVNHLDRVIRHTYLQQTAFSGGLTVTGGTVHLSLWHPLVPLPHPLMLVNATLDMQDGSAHRRIANGSLLCPTPTVFAGTWICDVPLVVTHGTVPSGSTLRLNVTWQRDEHAFSPVIEYGADGSRLD